MSDNTPSQSDADPSSISMAAALKLIKQQIPMHTRLESVASANALGRVIANTVYAQSDVPAFRCSAMDGYALRHADAHHAVKIAGQSLAGHAGVDELAAGTCQRITTGARVPDDADTVVQQENVTVDGNMVMVAQLPEKGLHVRAAGSDCATGSVLINAGQALGAADIALLAAHRITHVDVLQKLKVAVFSTGDELVDPDDAPGHACIVDANRPLLISLLQRASIQAIDLGIARDSISSMTTMLARAADADLVISSGGVSVGDADFVRPALEEQGELHLWKIAMKPGRPLTFGKLANNHPYFGLPGNPVSASVTCLFFVLPAIEHMLGQQSRALPTCKAIVQNTLKKLPGRVEYQRGKLAQNAAGEWIVSTTGLQDSHVLTSMQLANCFIELGLDSTGAAIGSEVNTIPFEHLSEPVI